VFTLVKTLEREVTSKTREIISLKDQNLKLQRENESLVQRERESRDILTRQVITIKRGRCNNCGKKFGAEEDDTGPFLLERCGAVSNSMDHLQLNILISLLAMVLRLYQSCQRWHRRGTRMRSPR